MNIIGIPHYVLDEQWETAEPLVQRALDETVAGNLYDCASIKEMIRTRDMQLWFVSEGTKVLGVAITQILVYPKAAVLDVLFMGGELYDTWQVLFNTTMKQYAEAHGCEYARGYGRLGWARKVKHLGIQPSIYFDVKLEGMVI